ncbi:hypothetical protein M8R20_19815 [Pseudomonas sp. R2.Fl]|nr:hypothetical protein [Pseudomonas sp. R2.Fl]
MNFSLTAFIVALWGARFAGALKIWSKATKKTCSYTADDIERLGEDVSRKQGTEDLYIGLSTQPHDLPEGTRGSNETAISLPGIVADIDFASRGRSVSRTKAISLCSTRYGRSSYWHRHSSSSRNNTCSDWPSPASGVNDFRGENPDRPISGLPVKPS